MPQRTLAVCTWVLAVASVGSLTAHHSLANHDTATPVRVKGTVIEFQPINPHSLISLEETDASGTRRRWAVEGPAALQLARRGVAPDILKSGDVIEVCGYVAKGQNTGRLITAELLVMPDGREQSWGDYGFHRCFAPGYKDQHAH